MGAIEGCHLAQSKHLPPDILQLQGKYQNQPPFPWNAGAEVGLMTTVALVAWKR